MPKTLTATTTAKTLLPWGAWVYLLQIDFTAPGALTLRVSDRYVVTSDGNEWLPLVADWGTLTEALNQMDVGGAPSTAEVTFINTMAIGGKSRLSDLIRTPLNTTGTYEFAFAKVTVYQIDEGLGTANAVVLDTFYLEDPQAIDERRLTLRMSDMSLMLEDKMNLLKIDGTNFPNADPADVGKTIPVIFGTLTNVPCYAVKAGARSPLKAAMTATDVSLQVSVATAFPAAPFTAQIGSEQLRVTAKSGTTFTVIRAYAGTTATVHGVGEAVWERPATFVYVVGENKGNYKIGTGAVTNVRANGVVLNPQPAINVDDTTLVGGRSFVSLTFTAPPNLAPLGIVDTLSVTTPSRSSVTIVSSNTPVVLSPPNDTTTVSYPIYFPYIPSQNGQAGINVTYTVAYTVLGADFNHPYRTTYLGHVLENDTLNNGAQIHVGGHTYTFGATSLTNGGAFTTLDARLSIDSVTANFEGPIDVSKTGSVSLSGNSASSVIFGAITCDVTGLKDDGAGTISGTPSLLLVNPADITKLILLACYPGVVGGDINTTVHAATRASLNTAGYQWAFLLDYSIFSALRRKLGEQARCRLSIEDGKWTYKYLAASPTADLTLDYRSDIWRDAPALVSKSPRSLVFNSLNVYSQRDYTKTGALGDRYQRLSPASVAQDLTQVGFTDPITKDVELDFVQDATTADALAAFWLGQWKRQRLLLDLVAFWNVLILDKVDYVAVSNHPVLAAYGDTAVIFLVAGKRHRLTDANPGRIQLSLVEAG